MKAITLHQPVDLNKLHLVDLPSPGQPGAGEIHVRTYASSFNFHDLGAVTGRTSNADDRIPMSDDAGVAEAIGEGADKPAVRDSVTSTLFPTWLDGGPTLSDFTTTPGDGVNGYMREYVIRPAHWFTYAPCGYSRAGTVTLTMAGLAVWRALIVDARPKTDDTVLVLGAGGVSIFAPQFAKSMGATVIATSSFDDKLARAQVLGADFMTDYRRDINQAAKVLGCTNSRGVGSVIEVGGPDTSDQSIQAYHTGERIVLIGVLTGITGPVPTVELTRRHQALQDLIAGSWHHQRDMIRAIGATGIEPMIDQVFTLEDIADMSAYQTVGKHFGKLCLSI